MKHQKLNNLYEEYKRVYNDKEIVLGEGNVDTDLLLIGEAPGKDEVRLSRPFVGKAGKNLSEFLDVLGIHREFIYITNVIKYRLSKASPKTGKPVNRPATTKEIKENRPYLFKEISGIQPKYIITLGNVPLRAVYGDDSINIGAVHGKVQEIEIDEQLYQLYPLYHPASIIYNRSLTEVYMKDIKNLKEILNNC